MTSSQLLLHGVKVFECFTSIYSWSHSIQFHFYCPYEWRNIQKTKTIGSQYSGLWEKKITNGPYNNGSSHTSVCVLRDVSFKAWRENISSMATLIFTLKICPTQQWQGVTGWGSCPGSLICHSYLSMYTESGLPYKSVRTTILHPNNWWMTRLVLFSQPVVLQTQGPIRNIECL